MKKDNLVCAIFGDGKFTSWTYGMFMQLVSSPKIYNNTDRMMEVIISNFKSKIKHLKEESNINFKNPLANLIVNDSQNGDKNKLNNYNEFEIRFYKTDMDYDNWNEKLINLDNPIKIYKYK